MIEHLTPLRAKVAYDLRNDKENIEKCWSIDGRLKVYKKGYNSTEKPTNINSLQDLNKLGWSQDLIDNLVFKK